jgi:predicted Zn-dependent peptidase
MNRHRIFVAAAALVLSVSGYISAAGPSEVADAVMKGDKAALRRVFVVDPTVKFPIGFFVKTGSRDETPEVSGVSHFLEHMVFKGTPHRTALEVNYDFDKIGASYNAFTSEENTVFYAAILPEYVPQAVDILADILRPSLRGEDFDMEKNVIIEEIGMYEDQPGWSAYDHAKKHYFSTHPLGNSILGTPESITALSRDQMAGYHQRRYVASNVMAVAAGNFDWQRFVDLVAERCGSWDRGDAPRPNWHGGATR